MKRFLVTFLILFSTLYLFISGIQAQTPVCGGKATLMNNGINQIAEKLLPWVVDQVLAAEIPDIHGDTRVTLMGHIDYDITEINLTELNVESFTITNTPPSTITAAIANLHVKMSMKYHYKQRHFPKTSGHGKADASTKKASASVPIVITLDENGKPNIKASGVSVKLGKFKLHLHGNFQAWLLNMMETLFNGLIKHSVEKTMREAITTAVDQIADYAMSSFDLIQVIDETAEVDFSFCSESITNDFISFGTKGEFYLRSDPHEAPFPTPSVPDSVNSKMVQIMFSEFVPNSASYVYYTAGKLKFILTNDDFSDEVINLNTTYFKKIIPKLYKECPDCLMEIYITATDVPSSNITSGGYEFDMTGDMNIQAVRPNGTRFDAFTLSVTMETQAFVSVETGETQSQLVVKAKLQYADFKVKVKSSNIGYLDLYALTALIQTTLSKFVVPIMNHYLGQGIVLPSIAGLTFDSPEVSFHDGFILIASNIDYTPQIGN